VNWWGGSREQGGRAVDVGNGRGKSRWEALKITKKTGKIKLTKNNATASLLLKLSGSRIQSRGAKRRKERESDFSKKGDKRKEVIGSQKKRGLESPQREKVTPGRKGGKTV